MALHGYAGKILHLDMTAKKANPVLTEKYRRWGGGHGLGSALFWDFCKDKTIKDGRNPANVVCVCSSPLTGTIAPSAGGRCDVVGVGVGQHPQSWYTRSGFGGRFSTMLKYAGWDAVVITGHADKPTWVEVVNDRVTFHDAAGLWGKDTWSAQQTIWEQMGHARGKTAQAGWKDAAKSFTDEQTTQAPAVLCIGPAGENQTAHGCLVHDAGNGAGQGGFGAVWGSKNLKAHRGDRHRVDFRGRSPGAAEGPLCAEREVRHVVGEARLRAVVASRRPAEPVDDDAAADRRAAATGLPVVHQRLPDQGQRGLRQRVHLPGDRLVHLGGQPRREEPGAVGRSQHEGGRHRPALRAELVRVPDRPALARAAPRGTRHRRCGSRVPSSLPWEKIGTLEFAEKLIHALSNRQDIGKDLADGWVQARQSGGARKTWPTATWRSPIGGCPTTATIREPNWSGATAASSTAATSTNTASTSSSPTSTRPLPSASRCASKRRSLSIWSRAN